jgi:ligand-binding SRPBCC domain-containing protein
VIRASPARVFEFHELPDALVRLMPPWEKSRIIEKAPSLAPGSRAIVETKILRFLTVRWVAEHTLYEPPYMFEDVQVSGPFKSWRHRHIVEPHEHGAVLRDEITFEPPFGVVGKFAAPLLILPRLLRLMDFRHEITRRWCEEMTGGN